MNANVVQFPTGAKTPEPVVELYTEIKTYVANVRCPTCEKGFMIALPVQEMMAVARTLGHTDYTQQMHRCDNQECKHEQLYADRYPALRYFNVGQEPK